MAKLLNYKYEIFPTKPQRAQFYRILRESKNTVEQGGNYPKEAQECHLFRSV